MTPYRAHFLAAQASATAARRGCRTVSFPARLSSTATACSGASSPWTVRGYATQHQGTSSSSSPPKASSSAARRRAVTPFNDDGRVPWSDLSAGEKTGRAAQQTLNFGLVIVGVVLTVSTRPTEAEAVELSLSHGC